MSLDSIIADVKRFSQKNATAEITFETPNGLTSAIVRGLVSKHNLDLDPITLAPINSRNSHVSIHESVLTDEGYPTRNAKNEIYLNKHTVSWVDASGQSFTYIIDETRPSETTGLIVCITGDFE